MVNRTIAAALPGIWLLCASVAGAPGPASLIMNGSFENGPNVRTFLNLAAGNTAMPGWVVTGEGVDYVSSGYWVSSDGMRAIDLDGSVRSAKTPPYVHGGIAQTFNTKPSARYRVMFDLAGNPNELPEVKSFRISAAGQSAEMSFNVRGKTGRAMGWQKTTWTFTAKETTTTLEFLSLTVSPQTGFGAAIDNVIVVEEPGPSVEVRDNGREIQVQFGAEVLFDTGKFELKPAAAEALRRLATLLTEHAAAPVIIEGHTDSVGLEQFNQNLSEQRANAVKQWLVANGIAAGRISTRGFGVTVPLAPNDTPEGRQKNRRVEARIQK